MSKVLEDFGVSWMIEDVGKHIDSRQFGSLKGSSTTYCLLDLIHNWLSELDNPGCYLRACFLDFSKAFDRIDHTIVIRKLIDCCPVWHNALPVKLSDSIERVQKRALRIIFPALHYQEALATTGCVPLHIRRSVAKLFTKIKEPEPRLRHLVPPTRSQALGRSLHNKERPPLISCKTERFKRKLFSGDVPLCSWHVI